MPLSTRELQLVISARNRATRELKTVANATDTLQRKMHQLSKTPARINVEAETRNAERQLQRMEQRIRELNKTSGKVNIDVETRKAEQDIVRLERELKRLSRFRGIPVVDVAIKDAQRELRDTISLLNELDRASPDFMVDADTTRAQQKLKDVQRDIGEIGRASPTIKVDVDYQRMYSASRSVARLLAIPAIASGIAILAGAFANVGAGAVAMGSSVVQASSVLAALPGLAAAGTSALGTLGAAFFGVFDAVGALTDIQKNAGQEAATAASQQENAARAIADAQRALRDAHEQVARQAIQNARSIGAAQRGVADAHRNVRQVAMQNARDIGDAEDDLAEAYRNRADVAEDAATAIADAEYRIKQAVIAQRDAAVDAREQIRSAEYSLAQAHRTVYEAELALHDARQQALDDLNDLREAMEDNALSIEGSEISLIEARKQLIEVSRSDEATMLDLRKARLAVAEAEDRLSDATQEARDDRIALGEAERRGIAGAQGVIDARGRIRDAQRAEREAQRDLTDAIRDGAKAQKDAARVVASAQRDLAEVIEDQAERQAEAQRGVRDAQVGLGDAHAEAAQKMREANRGVADAERNLAEARQDASWAMQDAIDGVREAERNLRQARRDNKEVNDDLTTSENNLAEAMRNLSPEQRAFARFIAREVIPVLRDMSHAAARQLLPALQQAFGEVDDYAPMVNRHLEKMGGVIGNLAIEGAKMVSTGPWRKDFQTVLDNNLTLVNKFGESGFLLANAFRNISVEALPVTQKFANLVKYSALVIDEFIAAKRESGELADFFDDAWKRAKNLWDIVLNVAGSVVGIGSAALDSGDKLIRFFENTTQKYNDFVNSTKGQNYLKGYFQDSVPVIKEIWHLLEDVAQMFLELGASPDTRKLVRLLRVDLLPAIQELFASAQGEFGEKVIKLIANIARVIARLIEDSGGLIALVDTFNFFAEALLAVTEVPGLGNLVKTLIGMGAAAAGVGLLAGYVGRLGRGIGGPIIAMTRFGKSTDNASRASRGLHTVATRGGLIGSLRGIGTSAGGAHRATKTLGTRLRGISVGRWGGIAAAGVAVAGIGAAAGGSSRSMNALTYGAMGAMTGAMLGPWGAAIGGGIGLIYGFATGEEEAVKKGNGLVRTLNKQTGAITDNTRKMESMKLAQSGVYDEATKLGIAHEDVLKAVAGTDAEYKDFQRTLGDAKLALQEQRDAGKLTHEEYTKANRVLENFAITVNDQRKEVDDATKAGRAHVRMQKQAKDAFGANKQAVSDLDRNFDIFGDTTKDVDDRLGALNESFEDTVGQLLDVDNSVIDTRDAFAQLRKSLKESSGAMTLNTQKGRDARRQFNDTTESVKDQIEQVFKQTGSVNKAREAAEKWIPKLDKAAGENEAARKKVEALRGWVDKLTKSVKDIPDKHTTDVNVNKNAAEQSIRAWRDYAKRMLTGITDEEVNVKLNAQSRRLVQGVGSALSSVAAVFSGGTSLLTGPKGKGRAFGGPVVGPGGPTDDMVPARGPGGTRYQLSNGEWVSRAAAVSREGQDRFRALDQGRATIVKLQRGGPVVDPVTVRGLTDTRDARVGIQTVVDEINRLKSGVGSAAGQSLSEILNAAIRSAMSGGFRLKGRTGAYGGVKPWVAAVGDLLTQRFGPFSGGIGGVAQRSGVSDHPSGHALDIMTMNNRAQGNQVARFMSEFPKQLAMSYQIWLQRIQNPPDMTWRGMEDRGSPTANHMDHVHISFLRSPHASFGRAVGGGPLGEQGLGGVATGEAQKIVQAMSSRRGWGRHWPELKELVRRESSWNPRAANPNSSARGLFQKMTSVHGAIEKTIRGQARWGLRYIGNTYGNPARALDFHDAHGYYRYGGLVRDRGGSLPRGTSVVRNNTGANEALTVLNSRHMAGLRALAEGGVVGRVQTRVKPPIRRILGKERVQGVWEDSEKMFDEISEWMGKTFHSLLTGSVKDVKSAANIMRKQLSLYQSTVLKGLKGDNLEAATAKLEKLIPRIRKQTEREYRVLERHAKNSAEVAKKLAKARADLAAQIEIRQEFENLVTGGAREYGGALGVQPAGDEFLFTADYIVQEMEGRIVEIERFNDQMRQLASMGLRDDLFKQFAEAGVAGAGQLVEALAAGGPAAVDAVNRTQGRLRDASSELGDYAADELYNSGIRAAQALVRGLEARAERIDRAANRLARRLARAIKRALGIASPSKVGMEIGRNVRASIDTGMDDEEKRGKPPGIDPSSLAPPPPPAGASVYRDHIEVTQQITVQELDPRKHAADLAYEFARRIGE